MIVEFKNVSCGYKDRILVSDLNFSFETGKATCILGANGIGKTTLFKSILGQLELLEGDITVDGISIKKLNLKRRAKIFAYVPQSKKYSYQFTVRDIILMGRASYIMKFSMPSARDYKIVNDIMDQLKIRNFSDKIYSELSGGEQQIVLFARAIVQEAQFILLDEPASNLDFKNQKKLLEIICSLIKKDVGILMVSHSPEHAFMCCDQSLLLCKNQSYIVGPTKKIVNENNLSAIYGVSVRVLEHKDKSGNATFTCCLD